MIDSILIVVLVLVLTLTIVSVFYPKFVGLAIELAIAIIATAVAIMLGAKPRPFPGRIAQSSDKVPASDHVAGQVAEHVDNLNKIQMSAVSDKSGSVDRLKEIDGV